MGVGTLVPVGIDIFFYSDNIAYFHVNFIEKIVILVLIMFYNVLFVYI